MEQKKKKPLKNKHQIHYTQEELDAIKREKIEKLKKETVVHKN